MTAHLNPAVFVVGCPRSGTTLLQRMLDAHPALAVTNDTHFLVRALEKGAPHLIGRIKRDGDVPLTPELVRSVIEYRRFSRLGIDVETAKRIADGCNSYAEFGSKLYGAFADARGKPMAGEKTPDFVRRLPLLSSLFPDAKFVHIIRDGRDTALSLLGWAHEKKGPGRLALWAEDPVATAALWWRWQVQAGRKASDRLDGRYYEVGYEALVEDPEETLEGLARFLGISSAPEMVRFHEGKERSGAGLSAKSAWKPATKGLRSWRRDMDPRDVAVFDALAGDLLQELGYEVSSPSPGESVTARRDRALAWWDDWRAERRRKKERRAAAAAQAGGDA